MCKIFKTVFSIFFVALCALSCNAQNIRASLNSGQNGVPNGAIGASHGWGSPKESISIDVFGSAPLGGNGAITTGGGVNYRK